MVQGGTWGALEMTVYAPAKHGQRLVRMPRAVTRLARLLAAVNPVKIFGRKDPRIVVGALVSRTWTSLNCHMLAHSAHIKWIDTL